MRGEKERGSAGLTETAAYERVIFGLENKLEEFKGIQQQFLNHIVREAEEKNRIEGVHKTHSSIEKQNPFSVCSRVDTVYFHYFVWHC